MQHPYGLAFSIITVHKAEGWRALALIPSTNHDGQLCGLYKCKADTYQVAHLFAVVNAAGDSLALAELNWHYRGWLR